MLFLSVSHTRNLNFDLYIYIEWCNFFCRCTKTWSMYLTLNNSLRIINLSLISQVRAREFGQKVHTFFPWNIINLYTLKYMLILKSTTLVYSNHILHKWQYLSLISSSLKYLNFTLSFTRVSFFFGSTYHEC